MSSVATRIEKFNVDLIDFEVQYTSILQELNTLMAKDPETANILNQKLSAKVDILDKTDPRFRTWSSIFDEIVFGIDLQHQMDGFGKAVETYINIYGNVMSPYKRELLKSTALSLQSKSKHICRHCKTDIMTILPDIREAITGLMKICPDNNLAEYLRQVFKRYL
jgi:hypothetical protein